MASIFDDQGCSLTSRSSSRSETGHPGPDRGPAAPHGPAPRRTKSGRSGPLGAGIGFARRGGLASLGAAGIGFAGAADWLAVRGGIGFARRGGIGFVRRGGIGFALRNDPHSPSRDSSTARDRIFILLVLCFLIYYKWHRADPGQARSRNRHETTLRPLVRRRAPLGGGPLLRPAGGRPRLRYEGRAPRLQRPASSGPLRRGPPQLPHEPAAGTSRSPSSSPTTATGSSPTRRSSPGTSCKGPTSWSSPMRWGPRAWAAPTRRTPRSPTPSATPSATGSRPGGAPADHRPRPDGLGRRRAGRSGSAST